ncbi:MAG: uridine monophosphate kinase [Cytophagaceae bacterium]|nr:MAG: uridine monophosphate kinase [Cytophagaceae bacterium]
MTSQTNYKRILLKLSGEALAGPSGYNIDPVVLEQYSKEIKEVVDMGVQVAIVIGGGNIFRGVSGERSGIDRVQGDYMGMLATVINAMAIQSSLEKHGMYTRVMSAIKMEQVCEPYVRRRAVRHLEKVVLKGTKVNGVYTADPMKDPTATRYTTVSFDDVYEKKLNVMDLTAFTLCQENNLPIIVFNMNEPGSLLRIVKGDTDTGTLITSNV